MKNFFNLVLVSVFFLSACHVTQIKVSDKTHFNKPQSSADKIIDQNYYVSGVTPNFNDNAAGFCKSMNGVAFVETKRSATNVITRTLISMIPFFLIGPIVSTFFYAPSTTKIYCVDSQV